MEHLGTFEPDVFARTSLHPRLKQPMRLADHLYFVAEHDDHHVAKIWELIDTLGIKRHGPLLPLAGSYLPRIFAAVILLGIVGVILLLLLPHH